MPIISSVEARSHKGRALLAGITIALTIGAITMVYPFLVMLGGSLTSEMDSTDMHIIPQYLHNDNVLYRKFLETKYDQDVIQLNAAHGRGDFSFRDAKLPDKIDPQQADLVRQFIEQSDLPLYWQNLGGIYGVKTQPRPLRDLQDRVRSYFHDDMAEAGRSLGIVMASWLDVSFAPPVWENNQYNYDPGPLFDIYFKMLRESDPANRSLVSITGYFLSSIISPKYGDISVEAYNKAHVRQLESYHDFALPQTIPGNDQPQLRKEWIAFAKEDLNPSFVVVTSGDVGAYHKFLNGRYDTVDELNKSWGEHYTSISDTRLPDGRHWLRGAERVDYQEFLRAQPPEKLKLVGPEYAWQGWLAKQGKTGSQRVPVEQLEYAYTVAHAGSLRWEYATRNFVIVLRQMLFQGRALVNTLILCVLMIGSALLINPLAAYAMSRFRLPGTYKALLILMATISFPPMVTTIPMFIMLRHIGWLNTFWALFIPTVADGYMIFLLMGFFDSLPRELYEAAEIDGFSEMRMFFQITLALSKPILAVVALGAFTAAYTMFLYALIVCPRPDMWLLSVWLFQFQQQSNSSTVFASILIAAIPTLVVFLLAQNIIMRGIVIPTEK
jgi:multiple sugar transport system permease protein